MIRDLSPLVGRRLAVGVVPDWHGHWPLAAHPAYCRFVRDASDEVLLHGCVHRRHGRSGPVSVLAEACDEMNGLDRDETHRALQRGQEVLIEAFGSPARGFLAPGWQSGHVRTVAGRSGLEYLLGYFAIEHAGARLPLATWSWDCGRWGWLGYLGEASGNAVRRIANGTISLALHPRDLERGFWPRILELIRRLLACGYAASTPGALLPVADADVAP